MTGAKEHTLFEKSHFNSHAHVERDDPYSQLSAKMSDFNSHAHVERDIQTKTENLDLKKFQLTRSRGA